MNCLPSLAPETQSPVRICTANRTDQLHAHECTLISRTSINHTENPIQAPLLNVFEAVS